MNKREQEFVNLLTDKLIEVAHNPNLRKDFKVAGIGLGEYRFFSEDIPSEIERIGLFYFNMMERNVKRALYWIGKVQNECINIRLLTIFYAICAQDAGDDDDEDKEEEALKYYAKYLEFAVQTSEGVDCSILQKYAQCLANTFSLDELVSLTSKIFIYGLHSIDITRGDALFHFNQRFSREQVELINTCLQLIKVTSDGLEGIEDSDLKGAQYFLNAYFFLELAYYYAATGRFSKAKESYQEFKDIASIDGYEDLYDLDNLSDQELQERYELFQKVAIEFLGELFTDGETLSVKQALGLVEPPKFPRPQKGSFDWLYNQAEKSYLDKLSHKETEQDYKNMYAVAEAYRTGDGVTKNIRLADCWEEMASKAVTINL